ncbi:unnamed protein product [Ixodes pacificus]
MLQSNPKTFWKVVNPKPDIVINLKNDDDSLVPDDECAGKFNDVFCSVFTQECNDMFSMAPPAFLTSMVGITFEPAGIVKIIGTLKISSSAGIDEINVKVLKNTKDISSVILATLFSQSLLLVPCHTTGRWGRSSQSTKTETSAPLLTTVPSP